MSYTLANYVDLQFAHNPIDFTYDEENDIYVIENVHLDSEEGYRIYIDRSTNRTIGFSSTDEENQVIEQPNQPYTLSSIMAWPYRIFVDTSIIYTRIEYNANDNTITFYTNGKPAVETYDAFKIGDKEIKSIMLGNQQIKTVYFGETKIYEFVDKSIVYENYEANNTAFSKQVSIDWETQKVITKIDTTNQTGTLANILSVGKDITLWMGTNSPHFHFYYTKSSNLLRMEAFDKINQLTTKNITLDSTTLEIEISKANGVVVNNISMNYNNSGYEVDPSTYYSDIWDLSKVYIGAEQGSTLSTSTYEYIKVVSA